MYGKFSRQCGEMTCFANYESHGERFCVCLSDTDFKDRKCPFYKNKTKYEKEVIEMGNNKIKVVLDEGAKAPKRAHDTDAGMDIFSRETAIIPARGSYSFDTGVHIEIPVGYVGMVKSKSGLNVKSGITSEGVIDSGYTGSIIAKLYNNSDEDIKIWEGDKITQIVILPIITPEIQIVDKLDDTERGNGGFGSTGKR